MAKTKDRSGPRVVTNPISIDRNAEIKNPTHHDYAAWSLEQLKHEADRRGIEGYGRMSQDQLVEALRHSDPGR